MVFAYTIQNKMVVQIIRKVIVNRNVCNFYINKYHIGTNVFYFEYSGSYKNILHPILLPRLIDKSILKQENNWSENVEIEPQERPCNVT